MKKVKLKMHDKKKKSFKKSGKSKIDHYYVFKDAFMVRIVGNFFTGGFNLSKNKARAVLENIDEIKEFVDGNYDNDIKKLSEDEVLVK